MGSVHAEARSTLCHSHMTTEEIEEVVQVLTTAVEILEAVAAGQSMQEALMQVRAYAGTMRAPRYE